MTITKRERDRVENGKAEILDKVEGFESVTFGHIVMAEKIVEALGLDPKIIMEAAIKTKKSFSNSAQRKR